MQDRRIATPRSSLRFSRHTLVFHYSHPPPPRLSLQLSPVMHHVQVPSAPNLSHPVNHSALVVRIV